MTLGKLLVQRGKRGKWYLRVAEPQALRNAWGKRERIKALGPFDCELAEQRAIPILAQWREEEGQGDSAQSIRRVPTEDELEASAVELGYYAILEYEDRRREGLRGQDAERWRLFQRRNAINLEARAQLTHSCQNHRGARLLQRPLQSPLLIEARSMRRAWACP